MKDGGRRTEDGEPRTLVRLTWLPGSVIAPKSSAPATRKLPASRVVAVDIVSPLYYAACNVRSGPAANRQEIMKKIEEFRILQQAHVVVRTSPANS